MGADKLSGLRLERRHASFDEVVEMITGMAVTIVDSEKIWELPEPGVPDDYATKHQGWPDPSLTVKRHSLNTAT